MDKNVYKRQFYLNKIRGFYHSDIIKVITGVRRCGKSYFLLSIINDLKDSGVPEKDIIYINLDKRGYKNIKTPDQLENTIEATIADSVVKYIFIDEIQNVKNYEEVVNSYREDGHSIFITGSNSYLLSGELSTKLTGRYIEIEMFPLNFNEYIDMKKFYNLPVSSNLVEEFTQYICRGGFPKTLELNSEEDISLYVKSVIEQIYEKDIAPNKKIRNRSVFERVKTYIINNFGATVSVQGIADYFEKQEHLNIRPETIHRYIDLLVKAKILYECPRFDVKSKKSLRGEQKYYLADLSIYFATNVDSRINYGPILENIMYCYLTAKSYHISVGRIGGLECDFITRKDGNYCYLQIAMTIAEKTTEDREYKPFSMIKDNYPKYLFTMDALMQKRDGVLHKNIIDFIANNEEL